MMKHQPRPRSPQNARQEWLSAFFTLFVLLGIYHSMDQFSSFADSADPPPSTLFVSGVTSVGRPYWNEEMGYGFRPLVENILTASGNSEKDTVSVTTTDTTPEKVVVSYYKNGDIKEISKDRDPTIPRVYSRLSGGIAVLEGDIESPTAKTIFSTLHSQ